MALTDTAIRAAKPAESPRKLFDGGGLFQLVAPTGTKSWRLKYRFLGKEKLITLGLYPIVTLKEARERALETKKTLANGRPLGGEKAEQTSAPMQFREYSQGMVRKTRAELVRKISNPNHRLSGQECVSIYR